MAIFPNDLLRDIFQNNIDYVSKQISRVLDELYGTQANENSTMEYQPLILHTCTIRGQRNNAVYSWSPQNLYNYVTLQVDINENEISIKNVGTLPYTFTVNNSDQTKQLLENTLMPDYDAWSYVGTLDDLGIEYLHQQNAGIYAYNSSGQQFNMGISQPFEASDKSPKPLFRCDWFVLSDTRQTSEVTMSADNRNRYVTVNPANLSWLNTQSLTIYPFVNEGSGNTMVYLPDGNAVGTDTVFNDYNEYTYNYNGDTIYNYYSDDGDLIINGGGHGITPVVGLGYADFKLIIDGLIDELNLKFNFGGDGNTQPLNYAPTWDELHYTDQGSFYIEPIKQIDKLPLAPDIADTVIDVSDYVDLLGGASTALFNALDGLGLSLMATFTFLSVLVIRHLKR